MFSRTISCVALLLLLGAWAAPSSNVAARNDGRTIEETQKGATYDEAGRVVKTTVPTSEKDKVTVSLKYDEQSRVQYVVLDDATQIGLIYDAAGVWQGYTFPDGGKMLFKRNNSGTIVGLRRVAGSARQKVPGAGTGGVSRVGYGVALVDGCGTAVAAAVAAAATATAVCLNGPSIQCATAVASAAVAAAKAYQACRDNAASVESAA